VAAGPPATLRKSDFSQHDQGIVAVEIACFARRLPLDGMEKRRLRLTQSNREAISLRDECLRSTFLRD
jgi:hypothetical protein